MHQMRMLCISRADLHVLRSGCVNTKSDPVTKRSRVVLQLSHLINITGSIMWRRVVCSVTCQIAERHDRQPRRDADCGNQKVEPGSTSGARQVCRESCCSWTAGDLTENELGKRQIWCECSLTVTRDEKSTTAIKMYLL